MQIVRELQYPRQESNLDLEFRKLLFYPLNYEGIWDKQISLCSSS